MNCEDRQYERVCHPAFAEIHAKLDRLDEAIRGNGKPGINLRLELLEATAASRRRLTWIILGAAVSAGASAILQLVQLAGRH